MHWDFANSFLIFPIAVLKKTSNISFVYMFQTLVAETLVLAKTHGYVEKIENELEEEILQETYLPKEDLVRWGLQWVSCKCHWYLDIGSVI